MFLCGVLGAAQGTQQKALACNLNAIAAGARPRYNELVKRLRSAVRDRAEVQGGYVYKLDGTALALTEAAEWIAMERLCCPFLTLQLSASGDDADWRLTLTGPVGAKAILAEEFPWPHR
jgi:hypothetical protein